MSSCGSCGAPVRWCVSEHGKPMPVDHDPVSDGNLRLLPGSPQPVALVRPQRELLDPGDDGVRYVSHFATCPNSAEHRKAKR